MKRLVLFFVLLSISGFIYSQGFSLVSTQYGMDFVNVGPDDGFGLSFFDYNQDGWDDLIYVLKDDSVKILVNNEGILELIPSPIYVQGDAKQPVWVDFDNDGDYDLFISVMLGPCLLFENQDGELVDISEQAGIPQHLDAMSYGNSWGDYDLDGDLDCYISNYNFPEGHNNWLLRNNGDGTFDEIAEDLGVNNGANTTFQSVWIDYDHDMWPDLYLINDKEPANALYHNNGDGTFTDVSEESNTDLVFNAMCAAVADYDNDEDLDIYMTNEPYGNRLLRNNNDGTFGEYASFVGLELNSFTWGSTWLDYDNNTFRDLIVCAIDFPSQQQNFLMINTGNSFVDGSWLGVDDEHHFSYGCAKGDFNNDGYYDYAVSNAGGDPQDLYKNDGGDNNWVKIDLEGIVSNKDAIGTWTSWWIGEEKYVDYTFCGEGYLSQDSQYEIVGLGSAEQIDSLFIEWPSGIEEMYYNIEAGSSVHIIEGYIPQITLEAASPSICEGDSTLIWVQEEFAGYSWSTGETLSEITVNTDQDISVTVTYNGGLKYTSAPFSIEVIQPAEVEQNIIDVSCFGESTGSISLVAEAEIDSVNWDNGLTSLEITDLVAGDYVYELWDSNGCAQTAQVSITQPDSLVASFSTTDVTCPSGSDGTVSISFEGGTSPYNIDFQGLDPAALSADNYVIQAADTNGCPVTIEFSIFEPYAFDLGLDITHASDNDGSVSTDIQGGTAPYSIEWSTNETGETVDGLTPGEYSVTVTDSEGCVYTEDFTIEQADFIQNLNSRAIDVFPNPASDYIQLSSNFSMAQLYSIEGRLIRSWRGNSDLNKINVVSVPNGTYILKVTLINNEQAVVKVNIAS